MNILQQNLSLLRQRNAELAARVVGFANDAQVSLQNTPSGSPTAIVRTQEQAFALHHPGDPIGQSRSFLESNPTWRKARNIAVLGGGLGYVPLLIHQAQSRLRNLFVLEPSLSVFRSALQVVDLSPLLGDRRVWFIVGDEPGAISTTLMQVVPELIANPLVAQEVPSVTAAFPGWLESAKRQLMEIMQFGQSGLFTKFKDGPLTLSHLIRNLESLAGAPGLQQLGGSLRNVPAIIVAAGPSLKKNIDTLKEAGDDFLVIATDTAFEPLLRHGIVPHTVITVDPTELNLKHFPRESYGAETLLLFDPESRPEIVRKFPRRLTFMTDKHPFFTWLDRQLGGKGIVAKGSMVSQAGLYAAHYLGCDPLILIGQDLALDPETGDTHNPETVYCRKAHFVEGDRQHADITVPVGEGTTTRENIFWVEGVDGEPVPTVQNFLVYLRMLAKDIRTFNLNLIDATEGGAKIPGSQIATLADTLRSYRVTGRNLVKQLQFIDPPPHSPTDSPARGVKENLRKLLESCMEWAKEGLQWLEKNPQSSQTILERMIDAYSKRIFGDPSAEYLIEYGAPRELFEFMKLGPATLSDEEERQQTEKRLRILLETVPLAGGRLMDYL